MEQFNVFHIKCLPLNFWMDLLSYVQYHFKELAHPKVKTFNRS